MAFNSVVSQASKLKGQQVVTISRDGGFNNMIKSISDTQEKSEPFYILDLGTVVRLMEKWNQSLPNVTPFYAVKCNTEPALLIALATLGAGFDCASQAEIETILGLGVTPDRIIYANPCKDICHIKYAAEVGVNLTTFDSKQEVDNLKKWHPKSELLLRIAVPNDTKFGATPDEVAPLLEHADQAGFKVVGVSFHVGCKALNSEIWRGTIAAARLAFDAAEKLNMPAMHILNIGGGFRDNPIFEEIVGTVNHSMKELFPNQGSLKVIAEPGRFFAETAFTMVTNVIGKRMRGEKIEYWIDDGIYGAFNKLAYDDPSSLMFKPLNNNEDSVITSSTIFGPTSHSLDIVLKECKLKEIKVHDLIVFDKMGAYTTAAATKFNGFERIQVPTYLAYSM